MFMFQKLILKLYSMLIGVFVSAIIKTLKNRNRHYHNQALNSCKNVVSQKEAS